MPSQQTLQIFKEGLTILQQAGDFATLRNTIDRMISICPAEELPLAKDAIARVIRIKQANEIKKYQGYPQAIAELDKKYQDLYIVLRAAQSSVNPQPQALPGDTTSNKANSITKAPSLLQGLNMPGMVINWLKTKRKYLIAGGAIGAAGGAYLLYKQLATEKEPESTKETNFDKTIKSIQKYKAFSIMMNDPNFSGDYNDLINGNYKKTKPKETKNELAKSTEWDREEKALMKDMDSAFSAISAKPDLDYQLPQLPAPKTIDPSDVIGDTRPLQLNLPGSKQEKPAPKVRKPRKVRTKRKQAEEVEVSTPEEPLQSEPTVEVTPKKRKPKKVKAEDISSDTPGRLIPIVKRTKRVRKVKA